MNRGHHTWNQLEKMGCAKGHLANTLQMGWILKDRVFTLETCGKQTGFILWLRINCRLDKLQIKSIRNVLLSMLLYSNLKMSFSLYFSRVAIVDANRYCKTINE